MPEGRGMQASKAPLGRRNWTKKKRRQRRRPTKFDSKETVSLARPHPPPSRPPRRRRSWRSNWPAATTDCPQRSQPGSNWSPPYASEQGIFGGLTGNFQQRTGNFLVRIGNSNFDLVFGPHWGR